MSGVEDKQTRQTVVSVRYLLLRSTLDSIFAQGDVSYYRLSLTDPAGRRRHLRTFDDRSSAIAEAARLVGTLRQGDADIARDQFPVLGSVRLTADVRWELRD